MLLFTKPGIDVGAETVKMFILTLQMLELKLYEVVADTKMFHLHTVS